MLVVLLVVIFGPAVAPHSPTAVAGPPLSGPTAQNPLGTDFLGRDVLSRLLNGGRTVVGLALAGTLVAYLIGLPAGLAAGYSRAWTRSRNRAWLDGTVVWCADLLFAFPPILFLLVVATGAPTNIPVMVLAVGLILTPGLARLIRATVLDVAQRGYVEAAVARGENQARILRREVLPNIQHVILADAGLRFCGAVLAMLAVNFLGLGLQPPTSDWALMIAENRQYLTLQPWPVVAPALAIALLIIATNLISDGVARGFGTSIEQVLSEETA
jgi:ABC-type dipeptide/oligopeptide/nickel transport system permease subunit